jgi:hypothetical protein
MSDSDKTRGSIALGLKSACPLSTGSACWPKFAKTQHQLAWPASWHVLPIASSMILPSVQHFDGYLNHQLPHKTLSSCRQKGRSICEAATFTHGSRKVKGRITQKISQSKHHRPKSCGASSTRLLALRHTMLSMIRARGGSWTRI